MLCFIHLHIRSGAISVLHYGLGISWHHIIPQNSRHVISLALVSFIVHHHRICPSKPLAQRAPLHLRESSKAPATYQHLSLFFQKRTIIRVQLLKAHQRSAPFLPTSSPPCPSKRTTPPQKTTTTSTRFHVAIYHSAHKNHITTT